MRPTKRSFRATDIPLKKKKTSIDGQLPLEALSYSPRVGFKQETKQSLSGTRWILSLWWEAREDAHTSPTLDFCDCLDNSHRKGSVDYGKSFGSNDIQRMYTLLTFESSAREHLVTETLGDISPLNTTELVLYLDWLKYLTLQADPDRHLSAPGDYRSISHLPAWLSKLLQAMPASKTYNKKRFKRTTRSGAAFMRTLR